MGGVLELLMGEQGFVVLIALFIVAMSLSRFGTRLLARWLGLTDANARRISLGIMFAIWLLIFLFGSGLSGGDRLFDIF